MPKTKPKSTDTKAKAKAAPAAKRPKAAASKPAHQAAGKPKKAAVSAPQKKTSPQAKPAAGKTAKPSSAKAKPAKPAAAAKPKPEKTGKTKPAAEKLRAPQPIIPIQPAGKNGGAVKLTPFLEAQKAKLLHLKDGMLDSMTGVARDSLRAGREGNEASAFGMHQADAGSDAYDRDFALNLLSQEQDALYEIDEALKRIDDGTYGVCEMSGEPIPKSRLEAIPFTRFTVGCQAQIEKQNRAIKHRQPVMSIFGLNDEEGGDSEEEETSKESND